MASASARAVPLCRGRGVAGTPATYCAVCLRNCWGDFWGYPRGHGIGNLSKDEEIYKVETVGAQRAMRRITSWLCWD